METTKVREDSMAFITRHVLNAVKFPNSYVFQVDFDTFATCDVCGHGKEDFRREGKSRRRHSDDDDDVPVCLDDGDRVWFNLSYSAAHPFMLAKARGMAQPKPQRQIDIPLCSVCLRKIIPSDLFIYVIPGKITNFSEKHYDITREYRKHSHCFCSNVPIFERADWWEQDCSVVLIVGKQRLNLNLDGYTILDDVNQIPTMQTDTRLTTTGGIKIRSPVKRANWCVDHVPKEERVNVYSYTRTYLDEMNPSTCRICSLPTTTPHHIVYRLLDTAPVNSGETICLQCLELKDPSAVVVTSDLSNYTGD